MNIESLKHLATTAPSPLKITHLDDLIDEAILIRCVEGAFLDLFLAGKMNGTVHTCTGQEFSAVSISGQLTSDDWVTSNHRCHGHFISKTKNWSGLIDELMGLNSGVCRGIGSSQHLFADGFISNGPQGALVPVAAGIALNKKINNKPGIAVSFIGEGTLGEGVIYETLNMNVLYKIPHLIVCENNFYSQSTPQHQAVAGDILDRPRSFGMKVFEANVWDLVGLLKISKEAIAYVRNNSEPAFLLIRTYRLNAHSKGDDNRNSEEINFFKEYDPINQLLEDPKWKNIKTDWDFKISQHIASVNASKLSLKEYEFDELSRVVSARLRKISNKNIRMVHALNLAYGEVLERGAFFIGEDISDPYGGAFKITKGFSTQRPSQVISTPISEAALVGISIGMTLAGAECYAEIMFGDFITHAFDQLINNASKMHHMTAFQISAPVRIRTPMGGKRGYGPTHSQSLEKFLLGIDNVGVISFTSLVDPEAILDGIQSVKSPLVMLENKLDYSNKLWVDNSGFELFQEVKAFGSLILRSSENVPTITIVSYGETARSIADNLQQIFIETDFIPELICLVQLHPLDLGLVRRSLKKTKRLLVVEDGSVSFGLGAEILASLIEAGEELVYAKRIGAAPVPIPSATGLESEILPTVQRIVKMINMGGI